MLVSDVAEDEPKDLRRLQSEIHYVLHLSGSYYGSLTRSMEPYPSARSARLRRRSDAEPEQGAPPSLPVESRGGSACGSDRGTQRPQNASSCSGSLENSRTSTILPPWLPEARQRPVRTPYPPFIVVRRYMKVGVCDVPAGSEPLFQRSCAALERNARSVGRSTVFHRGLPRVRVTLGRRVQNSSTSPSFGTRTRSVIAFAARNPRSACRDSVAWFTASMWLATRVAPGTASYTCATSSFFVPTRRLAEGDPCERRGLAQHVRVAEPRRPEIGRVLLVLREGW
jgi:hypothetical protein